MSTLPISSSQLNYKVHKFRAHFSMQYLLYNSYFIKVSMIALIKKLSLFIDQHNCWAQIQ